MDKTKSILVEVRDWLIVILIAILFAVILDSQILSIMTIQYNSMEYTLLEDQKILVEKLSYKFGEPKAGDIVIFHTQTKSDSFLDDIYISVNGMLSRLKGEEKYERYVKRIIGVSGDVIDIHDGSVYVNGVKLDEPYVHAPTEAGDIEYPLTVGENEYFVLGDNREVSIDSRDFGVIEDTQIVGKAFFRFFPFNKFGAIKSKAANKAEESQ